MPQKMLQTKQTTIRIYKESLLKMNKKIHSFYTNFDDLQSRIANLKSVENLKRECKGDSITIKK